MMDQTDRDVIAHDLIYKARMRYGQQGMPIDVRTIVVHPGPQAWKEVSLLTFLDAETGEILRRELRAQTWHAVRSGQIGRRYDFSETAYHWQCRGEQEIEALRAFLNDEIPAPGRYRLIQRGSEFETLADQMERGEITSGDIARVMELAGQPPSLVTALAASKSGSLLAEAVELQRRRNQLDELRRIVEDPNSTERDDIHPLLKQMTWIFGGRYVGEATRRQLSLGDVLDIPLLRADGSLHVVELKGANIPNLVRRHRGPAHADRPGTGREELPLIPGADVHEAYCQALNYLCHLDEDRDRILAKLKIEARRASATVLIGHPKFVSAFSDLEIAGALRVFNSDHSRIEVMHYQDLIENAERVLALAAQSDDLGAGPPPADEADDTFAELADEPDPWDQHDFIWSEEPPF